MKKKRKLNSFDLLLGVIVLALIVGLIVKFRFLGRQPVSETVEIPATFVLKVSPVGDYIVNDLRVGDTLYYGSSSTEMGVIAEISTEPAKAYANLSASQYDLYLTVETGCTKDDTDDITSYCVNEIPLLAGSYDSYHTMYASFAGVMQSVSISE